MRAVLRRLLDKGRSDSRPSARERSLEDAADGLGVTLGEYYPFDDYHDEESPAEIQDPSFVDRINASREELLTYIAASRSKRRRRRSWLMYVAAAGAIATVTVLVARETGIVYGTRASNDDVAWPPHWSDEIPPRIRSGAGIPALGPIVSIELPIDGARALTTAFVDLRGDLCMSIAFVVNGVTKPEPDATCVTATRITQALRRDETLLALSVARGDAVLAAGYARADVKRITIASQRRIVDAAISRAWKGSSGPIAPLKTFLLRFPTPDRA
jgi:hypothetical protein